MPSANPSILDWKSAEVEESVSTPCGGEHVRRLVFPTTPRSLTGTPRMPSEGQESPKTPRTPQSIHGGNNRPIASGTVTAIQKILNMQNAEIVKSIQSIQDSMRRHEAAIASLLTADSLGLSHNAGDLLIHSSSWAIKDHCMNDTEKAANVDVAQDKTKGLVATTTDGDAARASGEPGNEPDGDPPITVRSRNFTRILAAPKHSLSQTDSKTGSCMSRRRVLFERLLSSCVYDIIMTMLIIFNSVLIVAETDANAGCHQEASGCAPSWLFFANLVLLVVYTCEGFVVIDVYRWEIFAERSRLFEIVIVVSGYVDILISSLGESLPSMQILKLVRLTRLLRGMRLFSLFPELQLIVIGFISSVKVFMWGFVLLMLVLIILSISTIELLQDVNKQLGHDSEYCDEVFDSVWNATILFFQITAAGDSWGQCSIEIMKIQPLAFIFFGVSVVGVQIGFLNLIMSVIIERVEAARLSDIANRFRGKQREMKANKHKWAKLFHSLDADGNGLLTLDEIVDGFENVVSFREDWALLGIMTEDLPELFNLIDENQDGYVTLDELLEMLHKLYHSDRNMQQVTMSMQLKVMAERLEDRLKNIETSVLPSSPKLFKTAPPLS